MNEDGHGSERQRRLELNDKFKALTSLVPNLTKADRVSVLGDAIEYIHELQGTVKELKLLLVDNKIESSNANAGVVEEAAEDQSPRDAGTKSTICQLCNKYGHIASHCYFRFDEKFNNPYANSGNGSTQGNNSAYVASLETVNDPKMLTDSGATNYIRTRL